MLLIAPHLPRRTGYRICTLLGLVAWRFNAPARRVVERNLPYTLGAGVSWARCQRVLRDTFINLVKDYYDLVMVAVRPREEVLSWVVTDGLHRVDEARKAGKGVIAVFFHTSGFNLAVQAVLQGRWPTWVVAEPLEPPPMRRLVNRLRSSKGVRLLTADRAGVRKMIRALRANGVLGLAGDRGVSGTGAWVRFMGAPAFLPAGAAALALRTGAAILPIHVRRLPDERVLLHVGQPIEYTRTGDFDTDVATITQTITEQFQEEIRERPEQWVVVRSVWEYQAASEDTQQVRHTRPESAVR